MTLAGQTDNNPFIKGVKEYDVIRRYYISRTRGALLHDLYFFLYGRGFQIAFFVSLTGHLDTINFVFWSGLLCNVIFLLGRLRHKKIRVFIASFTVYMGSSPPLSVVP